MRTRAQDEDQRRKARVSTDFGGGHDDDHHFKASHRHGGTGLNAGGASTSTIGETIVANDNKITNI